MKSLTLAFLTLTAGARLGEPQAAALPACPTDDSYLRGGVVRMISNDRMRGDLGLTAVDPSHLRALSDPADAATCQTVRGLTNVSPDGGGSFLWTYYTADGFYFAASRQNKPGTHGVLFIFDGNWNRKDVVLL